MSRESIATVFESEHWLAVDKPAGWLTVPGRSWGPAEKAPPCLGTYLQEAGGQRLWPVHRLDREVSGLVLFARSAEAHREASAWFEGHALTKEYEAWAQGSAPAGGPLTWQLYLARGKKRAFESPEGKEAITDAQCEGPLAGFEKECTRWRLRPRTGRSHQLRVSLVKHFGPIVGDTLYGADAALAARLGLGAGDIALRAVSLDLSAISEAQRRGLPVRLAVAGLHYA